MEATNLTQTTNYPKLPRSRNYHPSEKNEYYRPSFPAHTSEMLELNEPRLAIINLQKTVNFHATSPKASSLVSIQSIYNFLAVNVEQPNHEATSYY